MGISQHQSLSTTASDSFDNLLNLPQKGAGVLQKFKAPNNKGKSIQSSCFCGLLLQFCCSIPACTVAVFWGWNWEPMFDTWVCHLALKNCQYFRYLKSWVLCVYAMSILNSHCHMILLFSCLASNSMILSGKPIGSLKIYLYGQFAKSFNGISQYCRLRC